MMDGEGFPLPPGRTLLDLMWDDLLDCITQLMESEDFVMDDPDLNRLKGRAEGISWCIGVLTQSPRMVNINEIKAEAMERWEEREREPVEA